MRAAVLAVNEAARALWPHSRVALFGSQATGLALPGSDLDVVVLGVGATLARAGSGFTPVQRKQLGELLEDLLDALLQVRCAAGPCGAWQPLGSSLAGAAPASPAGPRRPAPTLPLPPPPAPCRSAACWRARRRSSRPKCPSSSAASPLVRAHAGACREPAPAWPALLAALLLAPPAAPLRSRSRLGPLTIPPASPRGSALCCAGPGGLAADISLGAENGAQAVEFVRRQVLAVPPLRPLCLAVKAFLR